MRTAASLLKELENPNLSPNEQAIIRCQASLEAKEIGDYEVARQAMGNLWSRVGDQPKVKGLARDVAAEVLLVVGTLTGWIGSKNNVEGAQETAKNIISQSINLYQSLGDRRKVAEARSELAYCYWREGSIDEARIMLNEALERLTIESNTRAKALIRLSIVEWSSMRYSDALRILLDNSSLFQKIPSRACKGAYHNQLAMVFNCLAVSENRKDYIEQAITEYEEAEYHFKAIRSIAFRSSVLDNLGFLYYKLSRFNRAHEYLSQSHRLAKSVKDSRRVAIVEETQARVFIAEGKLKEAERVIRSAISILEKTGQQSLLAEALTTCGVVLSRSGSHEASRLTLERAIEVAHVIGALDKTGLAALTMVEELSDYLPLETLRAVYSRADQWLSTAQDQDTVRRMKQAASKLVTMHMSVVELAPKTRAKSQLSLPDEMLNHERQMIREALIKGNKRVTRAAELLGITHQALSYIIGARHPNLIKERSPIHHRPKKKDKGRP
jgi:tetratricopeptide (TPR) repeat protein